jgi:hypothetical protein
MKKYLDDLMILCGCGLVLYATYQLSVIAALFVGGFMLIGAGVILGLSKKGGLQ